MAGFADFPAQHVWKPSDAMHGCICWDGNPDNFEGPDRDCPTHGEHASAPAFDPHHVDSAFGPDAVEHLRREAHQLRHEADLVRFDQASDEAWPLEQQADVLDARAAEIESRIDSKDGATP